MKWRLKIVFKELFKESSANGDDLLEMMTINDDDALLGAVQGGSKNVY